MRHATAAGADGLMIEVHPEPEDALSDGFQSLKPETFRQLMEQIRTLSGFIRRTMDEVHSPVS